MGMNTPLIRAQSTLPALARTRSGLLGIAPVGPYQATMAHDSNDSTSGEKARLEREEQLQAELQALRHPHSGKPGEQRSWSYLATEGGKTKDPGRRK